MAWGGVCAKNMVALNLSENHKTTKNIEERKAFTLSIADTDHLEESDIDEYPLTLECKVVEMQHQPYGLRVLGEIVNVVADEKVLDEKEKVDASKLNAFVFDQFRNGYYKVGKKVGQAWNSGMKFMK